MGTVITGIALAAVIALVIRSMVQDKKKGKPFPCGGDCSHCGGRCR